MAGARFIVPAWSVLFVLIQLSSPALAKDGLATIPNGGPPAAPATANPSINSYVDYIPTTEEYPRLFAAIIGQLADAVRVDLKAAPNDPKRAELAKARFQPIIESLAQLRPKTARGYLDELDFLQGYAVERGGDSKQALTLYDQSLALRSDNLIAAFRRGIILIKTGDYEKALNQFKEIEWRSPSLHHEVYFEIADCLLHQNKKDEAVKYVEKAHQADPSFVPVLRQLVQIKSDILTTTRDPALRSQLEHQILGSLGQILQKNPEDRDAGLDYAALLLKFSDPLIDSERIDQASSIARKFAEKSEFGDEKAVMMLFDSLLKKRDIDGAEKALNLGLKRHPRSAALQGGKRQLQIERGIEG
jgi:tetratricopeptide (TPR) repeat protein